MKSALIISPIYPYPLNRGDRIRLHHFMEILAKRYSINLVYLSRKSEENRNIGVDIEEVAMESTRGFSYRKTTVAGKMLVNVLRKEPVLVSGYYSKKAGRYIKTLIENNQYDLIFIYNVRMLPYVEEIMDESCVLDFVDALSMNLDRERRTQRNVVKRIFAEMNYRKMFRYEQRAKNASSHSIVSSETDFAWLGLDPESSMVIPNCVDTEYFHSGRAEAVDPKRIAFLGNMGYYPNREAALFLAEKVFPLVQERVPGARLLILGDNPGKVISRLGERNNIEVTGFVPDIREYLEGSALLAAPLNVGSGTKIKILQAMAMGLPVVCTPLANEGIRGYEEDGIFVSGLGTEFSEAIVKLLEDEDLLLASRSRARGFIERNFSREMIEERLLGYL